MNRIYRFLTKKDETQQTTCCQSELYAAIEQTIICTNSSCNNYLAPTMLKKNFSNSFSHRAAKTA